MTTAERKIITLLMMILLISAGIGTNGILRKVRTVDLLLVLALGICIGALISTISSNMKKKNKTAL